MMKQGQGAASPAQKPVEALLETRLFMLDMDGTFYLGDGLLPGALEFLDFCRTRGVRFTFLTNNSSQSAVDYIAKLARMGVHIQPDEMLTSGDATLQYLAREGFGKQLMLLGTESLEADFIRAGYEVHSKEPEVIVLGFDKSFTYGTLTRLCDMVRAGLPYIATHADFNCPVPGGFVPDTGALIAYVKAATGREPDVVIGKPNEMIARAAAERAGLQLADLCMIGDRLYTDIALGQCGVQTALVLCGETSLADLAESDICPDHVFRDLEEMRERMQGAKH